MKKSPKSIPKPHFTRLLLQWNREQNTRQMPWKGEKDPYKIWLSEIILQQTRVEQGLRYYEAFVKAFQDIHQLALAKEAKVFKLWEGLGYYSRCRNLIATAKFISKERKGKFPGSYEAIRGLKGVGPYTAAAISSFAFSLPHAVLDGNVYRVLSRVFGISKATDSTEGRKYFSALAEELLDKKQPGIYNQAIMDFGATVCKPAAPLCETCVFKKHCIAYRDVRVDELPRKEKKIKVRKRWFYYLLMGYKNKVAIRQRTEKDIWQGLYEFPLIETAKATDKKVLAGMAKKKGWISKADEIKTISALYSQQLSHQSITGRFLLVTVSSKRQLPAGFSWVERSKINRYPFPRFINRYLENK